MNRPESAAGRWGATESAGQTTSTDSLAEHGEDGKQAALHRRHLDESQRAMVAGKLANLRDGQRADRAASIDAPSLTQSQAADLLNVSRQTALRSGLSQSSFGRVAQ